MTVDVALDCQFDAPVAAAYRAVSNTDGYPRLFSEVVQSRTRWLSETSAAVDLMIAAGPFRERFVSSLTVAPNKSIEARLIRGTLRSLTMSWTFSPIDEHRTLVRAKLSFDPKVRLAAPLIQRFADAKLPAIAQRFAREALELAMA